MSMQTSDTSFKALLSGLSESTYRWILKACTNTAATMKYLHNIGRRISDNCPKCSHSPETLHHVINNCPISLNNGLYTWRHNLVLEHLFITVQSNSENAWEVRADLSSSTAGETIPTSIIVTGLKPDLTLTNRATKTILICELTICWDSNFLQAKNRKQERYQELSAELTERGWTNSIITIEIGSRGFSGNSTANNLKILIKSKKKRSALLNKLNQISLTASHAIFVHRTDSNWNPTE